MSNTMPATTRDLMMSQISGLEVAMQAMQNGLDAIGGNPALADDVANLQTTVGQMQTDLTALENTVASMDVSSMQTSINQLQTDLTALQTTVDSLGGGSSVDLTPLQNDIAALQDDVATLQTQLASLSPQSDVYTASHIMVNPLSAYSTTQIHLSVQGSNLQILGVRVETVEGLEASFSLATYTDMTHTTVSSYLFGNDSTSVTIPAAQPVYGPRMEAYPSAIPLSMPYQDQDGSDKLHMTLYNNSGQSHTFKVHVIYMAMPDFPVYVQPDLGDVPLAPSLTLSNQGADFFDVQIQAGDADTTGYTKYQVLMTTSSNPTGYWSDYLLAPLDSVETISFTSLSPDTYSIKVRAVNAAGVGAESGLLTVDLAAAVVPPDQPTINNITVNGSSINVGYTLGNNGGSPWSEIQWSFDNTITWQTANLQSDLANGHTGAFDADISGLTAGDEYNLYIRVTNEAGLTSSTSDPDTFVIPSGAAVPDAPVILGAYNWASQSIYLYFTPPADNGSSILRYERTINGTFWSELTEMVENAYVISNLANNNTYYPQIRAVNAIGEGPASDPYEVYVAGVPNAPVITGVTAGDGQAEVSLVPPTDFGGGDLVHYEYTFDAAGNFDASTWVWNTLGDGNIASPQTISGLTNGQTYQVAIRAVNNYGGGGGVAFSTPFTPEAVASPYPSAPTNLTVQSEGTGIRIVGFNAPADTGDSAIIDYHARLDGGVSYIDLTSTAINGYSLTQSHGIALGTEYSVQVRAVNDQGFGDWSTIVGPVMAGLAPTEAPSVTLDSVTDTSISFYWSGASGGSGATGHEYSINGVDWLALSGSPVTISDLSSGTEYTIRVRGFNAVGPSPEGTLTASTTSAATVPDAPTITSITWDEGTEVATLNWTPPANNNGILQDYQYSINGGVDWTTLTGSASGTSYEVAHPADTSRDYLLRAVNDYGASVASEPYTLDTTAVTSTAGWTLPEGETETNTTGWTLPEGEETNTTGWTLPEGEETNTTGWTLPEGGE